MRIEKDDLLHINPIKSYENPNIPTLINARKDSTLLKKLPSRWKKNATVVTLVGLMGTMTLSACSRLHQGAGQTDSAAQSTAETTHHAYVERGELISSMHLGGSTGVPFYVVRLTEQEAFGIIRALLESYGLNFNATPPDYTFDHNSNIGIDLFDGDRGVAITYLRWGNFHPPTHAKHWTENVANNLNEQTSDITHGVFYNPVRTIWSGISSRFVGFQRPSNRVISNGKVESRPILEAELITQVQEFIAILQEEGIITPTQNLP